MKLKIAIKQLRSDKPLVFIVCSTKGGVRKSRLAAFIYHCLRCMGFRPIVIALDSNTAFRDQVLGREVTEGEDFYAWDGNDESDAMEYLHPILLKARACGQPVIIDLAAKGGKSGGVKTITRTGLLRFATVIGLCPVTVDEKSAAGVIEAIEEIEPDRWIEALFIGNRGKVPKFDTYSALTELEPAAVANMPELRDDEAAAWGEELPVLPPDLDEYLAMGGLTVGNWGLYGAYWADCKRILDKALLQAVPELLDTEPVGAESDPAKAAPSAGKATRKTT